MAGLLAEFLEISVQVFKWILDLIFYTESTACLVLSCLAFWRIPIIFDVRCANKREYWAHGNLSLVLSIYDFITAPILLVVLCSGLRTWQLLCKLSEEKKNRDFSHSSLRLVCWEEFVALLLDIPAYVLGFLALCSGVRSVQQALDISDYYRKREQGEADEGDWRLDCCINFAFIFVDMLCILLGLMVLLSCVRATLLIKLVRESFESHGHFCNPDTKKRRDLHKDIRASIGISTVLLLLDCLLLPSAFLIFLTVYRIRNFLEAWRSIKPDDDFDAQLSGRMKCIGESLHIFVDMCFLPFFLIVLLTLWRANIMLSEFSSTEELKLKLVCKSFKTKAYSNSGRRITVLVQFYLLIGDLFVTLLALPLVATAYRLPMLLSSLASAATTVKSSEALLECTSVTCVLPDEGGLQLKLRGKRPPNLTLKRPPVLLIVGEDFWSSVGVVLGSSIAMIARGLFPIRLTGNNMDLEKFNSANGDDFELDLNFKTKVKKKTILRKLGEVKGDFICQIQCEASVGSSHSSEVLLAAQLNCKHLLDSAGTGDGFMVKQGADMSIDRPTGCLQDKYLLVMLTAIGEFILDVFHLCFFLLTFLSPLQGLAVIGRLFEKQELHDVRKNQRATRESVYLLHSFQQTRQKTLMRWNLEAKGKEVYVHRFLRLLTKLPESSAYQRLGKKIAGPVLQEEVRSLMIPRLNCESNALAFDAMHFLSSRSAEKVRKYLEENKILPAEQREASGGLEKDENIGGRSQEAVSKWLQLQSARFVEQSARLQNEIQELDQKLKQRIETSPKICSGPFQRSVEENRSIIFHCFLSTCRNYLAIVLLLIIFLTMYRVPNLLRELKSAKTKQWRTAVVASECLEILKDIFMAFEIFIVVIFVYRSFQVVGAVYNDLFIVKDVQAARKTAHYYLVELLVGDILWFIAILLKWRTWRILLATSLVGFLVPADMISHLMQGILPQKWIRHPTSVICSIFLLALPFILVFGVADSSPSSVAVVYTIYMAALVLVIAGSLITQNHQLRLIPNPSSRVRLTASNSVAILSIYLDAAQISAILLMALNLSEYQAEQWDLQFVFDLFDGLFLQVIPADIIFWTTVSCTVLWLYLAMAPAVMQMVDERQEKADKITGNGAYKLLISVFSTTLQLGIVENLVTVLDCVKDDDAQTYHLRSDPDVTCWVTEGGHGIMAVASMSALTLFILISQLFGARFGGAIVEDKEGLDIRYSSTYLNAMNTAKALIAILQALLSENPLIFLIMSVGIVLLLIIVTAFYSRVMKFDPESAKSPEVPSDPLPTASLHKDNSSNLACCIPWIISLRVGAYLTTIWTSIVCLWINIQATDDQTDMGNKALWALFAGWIMIILASMIHAWWVRRAAKPDPNALTPEQVRRVILQAYDTVNPGSFVGEEDWKEEWKSSVVSASQSTTLALRLIELEERIMFSALDQRFLETRGEWRTMLKGLYVRLEDTMSGAQALYNSVSLTKELVSTPVVGSTGAFNFRLNDRLPFDNLKDWLRFDSVLNSKFPRDSNTIKFIPAQSASMSVAGWSEVVDNDKCQEDLAHKSEALSVGAQRPWTLESDVEGGQRDQSHVDVIDGSSLCLQDADAPTEAGLSHLDPNKPQQADTPSLGIEDQSVQLRGNSMENPETKEDQGQDCAAKQHDVEDIKLKVDPCDTAGSDTGSLRTQRPEAQKPGPERLTKEQQKPLSTSPDCSQVLAQAKEQTSMLQQQFLSTQPLTPSSPSPSAPGSLSPSGLHPFSLSGPQVLKQAEPNQVGSGEAEQGGGSAGEGSRHSSELVYVWCS